MIKRKLGWMVGVLCAAAAIGIKTSSAAPPGHAVDPSAQPAATAPLDEAPRASTRLRCYYRTSNNPFQLDTRYVWATDPETGGAYRLPGAWHGGQKYHWQALFYTKESHHDLRTLCDESLQRRGIAARVATVAAGNSAFAFDYSLWSASTPRPGTGIDRIVAFGDSLSDTHNLYNASRGRIPDSTSWYAGRFTNGRNWVEYLAGDLHVPLYDWAVGGVGVSDRRVLPWADIPGTLSQARQWQRATSADSTYDPGRTLFTVLVGGNDLIFFDTPVQEVLAKERQTLQVLIDGGAKNILVLNLPDVSRAPIFKLKPGAADVALKVAQINRGLSMMIASMQKQYGTRLDIQLFDTNALFTQLFDDPRAYGFQNSTQSCLDINRTGFSNFMEGHTPRPDCTNPDTYVFWDILHPTTHTHRILADQVSTFVRQHFPAPGAPKS